MADPRFVQSLSDVYDLVHVADEVQIGVRFGVIEETVTITKREARRFLDTIDEDATPESMEMFASCFATWYADTGVLILG